MSTDDAPLKLDEATRARIRDAQLAWFVRWLEGDDAQASLRRLVANGRRALLSARPAELLDAGALARALAAALDAELVRGTLAPAVLASVAELARRLGARAETPLDLVGPEAAARIAEVVELPEIVSEAVVRAVVTSPAVERALGEVLFEAVDGTSRKLNPFVAEWGLPALLDALPALARATVKSAVTGVQREFERRLEPETKRYLEGFVRQGLERGVRHVATRGGDPELVAIRQQIATAVLGLPLSTLVWPADGEAGRRALSAIDAGLRGLAAHPALRAELESALAELLAEASTVGALLANHGVTLPPLDAAADAIWPGVRMALSSPETLAELGARLDESLAHLG